MNYSCTRYELKCNECGKRYGNQPLSGCPDCLAPLEIAYDLEAVRGVFTREAIAAGPANIWRYASLLPIPDGFQPDLPVGFTPLVKATNLGKRIGASNLYVKNDAVCFPTLSFKDRVVSVALANAQRFGFETVGASSTGNLANSVAAQAARLGIKACILVPADLEAAKILNTQVYGARLIRIDGNYDHVNRLCTLIADEYNWGLVNVNLRPYYAEGSKTVGYEIAEQLGWRLPDNVVVPMAGGSLIRKIRKAFQELIYLGLVEDKPVRFFGAQATGCSPISQAVKQGTGLHRAAASEHDCAFAGDRQSGRRACRSQDDSRLRRLGRGCLRRRDRLRHAGTRRDRGHLHRDRRRRHHGRHRASLRSWTHLSRRTHRDLHHRQRTQDDRCADRPLSSKSAPSVRGWRTSMPTCESSMVRPNPNWLLQEESSNGHQSCAPDRFHPPHRWPQAVRLHRHESAGADR